MNDHNRLITGEEITIKLSGTTTITLQDKNNKAVITSVVNNPFYKVGEVVETQA